MNGHLGFNLKSLGHNRECLNKGITECTVSGHNVLNIAFKKCINTISYYAVTKVMERSLILRKIRCRKSVTNYHVRIVVKNLLHHLWRIFHRVGIVAVHHNVAFRINLTEHSADNITLALHIFMAHNRTCRLGKLYGPVAGIIIIYINRSFRECRSGILYYLFHCFFFIITRNQYCDFVHQCSPFSVVGKTPYLLYHKLRYHKSPKQKYREQIPEQTKRRRCHHNRCP